MRHLKEELRDLAPFADNLRELSAHARLSRNQAERLFSEQLKYQFIVARRAIDVGRPEVIEDCLKRIAADISQADARITTPWNPENCELLNNIVYHSMVLTTKGFDVVTRDEHRKYYDLFEHALNDVYSGDIASWPDNFTDTYSWVRLILLMRGDLGPGKSEERERVLHPLRLISRREYVSNVDIADFRSHAQQAEAYFEGRND
jgi:hypothetical protein